MKRELSEGYAFFVVKRLTKFMEYDFISAIHALVIAVAVIVAVVAGSVGTIVAAVVYESIITELAIGAIITFCTVYAVVSRYGLILPLNMPEKDSPLISSLGIYPIKKI